jgi:hypothetical protein
VLAPQLELAGGEQCITKTGTMDDTILIDKPSWLPGLLRQHFAHLAPGDPLFPLEASHTVSLFKNAAIALGLPAQVCLYQLRHGGASDDLLTKERAMADIKSRGRWKTESSLRRYAKPAQVHRLLASLPPEKLLYARSSWQHLEELMTQQRAPRLP